MTRAEAALHQDIQAGASSPGRHLAAGAIAGQIAGLIMAVVMMAVFTLFLGKGPLYPVQVIGSFVFGDAAIHGFNLPALLAGLVLHQAGPSLLWGVVFGGVLYALDIRRGVAVVLIGAITGLVSQVVDVNLVLPAAMKALHGHDIWAEQVPAFWSWAAHLVFGLGLAVFPSGPRQARLRLSLTTNFRPAWPWCGQFAAHHRPQEIEHDFYRHAQGLALTPAQALGPSGAASAHRGSTRSLVCFLLAGVAACGDSGKSNAASVAEGKQTFRFDTFGDETKWTDALRMNEVVATVDPTTALAVGLKVDSEALPAAVVAGIQAGTVSLDDPPRPWHC